MQHNRLPHKIFNFFKQFQKMTVAHTIIRTLHFHSNMSTRTALQCQASQMQIISLTFSPAKHRTYDV